MELRIIDTADFNPIFERITKDFPRNERPRPGDLPQAALRGKMGMCGPL